MIACVLSVSSKAPTLWAGTMWKTLHRAMGLELDLGGRAGLSYMKGKTRLHPFALH